MPQRHRHLDWEQVARSAESASFLVDHRQDAPLLGSMAVTVPFMLPSASMLPHGPSRLRLP